MLPIPRESHGGTSNTTACEVEESGRPVGRRGAEGTVGQSVGINAGIIFGRFVATALCCWPRPCISRQGAQHCKLNKCMTRSRLTLKSIDKNAGQS